MTSSKQNALWKIDLMEVKFYNHLPRFTRTKKLLEAKNNQKVLKHLPNSEEEAKAEIIAMKKDTFQNKYHGSYKKLNAVLKKIIKTDLNKWSRLNKASKPLIEFVSDNSIIEDLITSKLVKCIQLAILVDKVSRTDPPSYISSTVIEIIKNKSHKSNPSKFFIDHCQDNKDINNWVSNLWNSKAVKPILTQINWSMVMIRGNLSEKEKQERQKSIGKSVGKEGEGSGDGDDESEDDDDDESDSNDSESEVDNRDENDMEKFAVYDNLVGDSDDENEDHLDSNVNYNEITDEEPSDEEPSDEESSHDSENDQSDETSTHKSTKKEKKDDFFDNASEDSESKSESTSKYNLPSLTTGYFSGGSDDEEDNFEADNDKVVRQATSQRKNRRGQRARQKIWEQKYGKSAKHKQKEQQELQSEREQRQQEYEERVRKRQLKAKWVEENAPSGSNTKPLGERKVRAESDEPEPKKQKTDHPSWQAKKLEEERLKNVKFTGKKITFD